MDAARLFETETPILAALGREVGAGPGWRAWRCDDWPTWYHGNAIQVLADDGRALADWEECFARCFDPELHRHCSLILAPGVETDGLLAEAEARGWLSGRDVWLGATEPSAEPRPPEDCVLRPLDLDVDGDWEAFVGAALDMARDQPWFDGEAGFRRFFGKHRPLTGSLGIHWPALWGPDGTLRAWLGWFADRELARAQNVMTVRAWQGRGLCSFLLRHSLRTILGAHGLRGWALCCEQGSAAHRLYLRHGFVERGQGAWLLRLPVA